MLARMFAGDLPNRLDDKVRVWRERERVESGGTALALFGALACASVFPCSRAPLGCRPGATHLPPAAPDGEPFTWARHPG